MKKLILYSLILFSTCISAQEISDIKVLDLEDGLNERVVNRIARDRFGFFYLFYNNSIQRYDGSELESVQIPEFEGVLLKDINQVTQDSEGNLVADFEYSDNLLLIGASQLTAEYKKRENPKTQVGINQNTEKWIVRGQDTIVASKGRFWYYKNGHKKIIANKASNNNYKCNILSKDNYGNIIAAFGYYPNESDSVYVLTAADKVLDYSSILSHNSKVKDIYSDNINEKWMVGTFNGLSIVSFKKPGVESFHKLMNIKSSQFGHIVMGVSADGPDVLFTDERYGIRRITEEGSVELIFENDETNFFNNNKIVFNPYHDNYHSIAGYTDETTALFTFDTSYTDLKRSIIPFSVQNFIILNEQQLLFVGYDRLLPDEKSSGVAMIWDLLENKGSIVIENVPYIKCVEYVDGKIWLGTINGIYIYNNSYQYFDHILVHPTNPYVRSIKAVSSNIVVGMNGEGLYTIDRESKEILYHLDKTKFLSDDIIAGIESHGNNIWASTFNGINVINDSGEIISKVMGQDGLSHREMNTGAISIGHQDNIYVGTLNGLTKINSEEIRKWTSSQGLHLDKVFSYANGKRKIIDLEENPIAIEANFDSLELGLKFPNYIETIFDTPLNNILLNDKSADRFSQDGKHLIVLPSDLTDNSTIKLSNTGNDYNQVVRFHLDKNYTAFVILLLFWLTVTGALISFFYRRRVKIVESEKEAKIQINKKIAELELSALQTQMNPHFIFNALGALQYFMQTEKTDEADDFLTDFALLMRKILESSKSKYITLKEEYEILDLYLKLEKTRFGDLFDYDWHINEDVDLDLTIPPMILQPFIENAIIHGINNLKDRKGQLDIYLKQNEHYIEYTIKDNGVGRKQAASMRNKKHKPRGMEIVQDRIMTLNSLNDIKIKVETIDMYEKDEPIGTTVIIKLIYK